MGSTKKKKKKKKGNSAPNITTQCSSHYQATTQSTCVSSGRRTSLQVSVREEDPGGAGGGGHCVDHPVHSVNCDHSEELEWPLIFQIWLMFKLRGCYKFYYFHNDAFWGKQGVSQTILKMG